MARYIIKLLALSLFLAGGCADTSGVHSALTSSSEIFWTGTIVASDIEDPAFAVGTESLLDFYGPFPDGSYRGSWSQLGENHENVSFTWGADSAVFWLPEVDDEPMVVNGRDGLRGRCAEVSAGTLRCDVRVDGAGFVARLTEFTPELGVGVSTGSTAARTTFCPATHERSCGSECCTLDQGCSPLDGCYAVPRQVDGW